MTWQDSLRQLDARLAKGEIGAAEYRKTRDEILAEASSGAANQGRPPQPDLWAAGQANAQSPDEDTTSAETTLVVKVDQPEEDETTQVVSAEQIPPRPAEPTAPAAPVPHAPPPAGVHPTQYRAAPIQGQEIFAGAGPDRRGGGGLMLRVLVPLLVLALAGAAVWWFALREDGQGSSTAQPQPTTSASGEATTTDEIAGLLPELPGKAKPENGTMTLAEAGEHKLFTPTYTSLLADNGASEVVYRGSVGSGAGYLLVASPIPPANGADGVAVLTSEHLQRAGFAPAEEVSPEDPQVITRTDRAFRTFIAVYSSGDVWIQLNVSGAPDGDERELRDEFQRVLGSLTERLPAD